MRLLFLFLIFFFNLHYLNAVEFFGKFEQGSFILGKTKPNSKVKIDNKKIRVSKDGFFAFGLDRDRKNNIIITIKEDGKTETIEKQILKGNIKFKELMVCHLNKLLHHLRYTSELKKTTF